MKKMILVLAAIFALSFTVAVRQSAFGELQALTGGVWVMKTKKGQVCEQWKKTGSASLSGESFRVVGTDTTRLEQVELVKEAGDISYNPIVAGQNNSKPVRFALTGSKDGQFIFTNPGHDFPQRVVYHFISKDSLHAWIDGKLNGKEARSDFYYARRN